MSSASKRWRITRGVGSGPFSSSVLALRRALLGRVDWIAYRYTHSISKVAFVDTHLINLSPQVEGDIVRCSFRSNKSVKKGNCWRIDPSVYQREVQVAEARWQQPSCLAKAEADWACCRSSSAGVDCRAALAIAKEDETKATDALEMIRTDTTSGVSAAAARRRHAGQTGSCGADFGATRGSSMMARFPSAVIRRQPRCTKLRRRISRSPRPLAQARSKSQASRHRRPAASVGQARRSRSFGTRRSSKLRHSSNRRGNTGCRRAQPHRCESRRTLTGPGQSGLYQVCSVRCRHCQEMAAPGDYAKRRSGFQHVQSGAPLCDGASRETLRRRAAGQLGRTPARSGCQAIPGAGWCG